MSASYLGRYFDAGLEIPKSKTQAEIAAGEVERLSRALALVLYASTVPRRVGSDATNEELAIDKKRCRRVAHALKQSLAQWSGHKEPKLPNSEELRAEGARIDWKTWGEKHVAEIHAHAVAAVTWALQSGGKERWAKSAVVHFENERNWIQYALRD